jgi:hypothetical protein
VIREFRRPPKASSDRRGKMGRDWPVIAILQQLPLTA